MLKNADRLKILLFIGIINIVERRKLFGVVFHGRNYTSLYSVESLCLARARNKWVMQPFRPTRRGFPPVAQMKFICVNFESS